MAGRKKKKSGKKTNRVRVDFRPNRAKRTREKDWSKYAPGQESAESDPHASERVVARGDLSRKRTITVGDDARPTVPENAVEGVVVKILGRIARVDDGQQIWPCTVRRILRTLAINDRNAVTIGDKVYFTLPIKREGLETEGVIESVKPRHGVLKRVSGKREHIVVANVDQAIIVVSAQNPKPHLADRYIVSAHHGQIEPIVCLNKIDLVSKEEIDQFCNIYRKLGYKTLATSALTNQGIDELIQTLAQKESVVAGQSGVGKSSLLNAVQPDLALKVGVISTDTEKGRHTTTTATLIRLDCGGYVVDTPGVRSFDLSNVPKEMFESYFVEFVDRVPNCKYPNCTHTHETSCAVKLAVENNDISHERYESYVRMLTDAEMRRSAR
jgi:ribosome biogenesis GTPase / thiamine phosphate phosphatase